MILSDLVFNGCQAFGLHANANLSAAIKEGLGVLSTANSMLPKGGGDSGGGKSSEQVLTELSGKFLNDVRRFTWCGRS